MIIFELLFGIILLWILFVLGSSVIITLLMVVGVIGFQESHNALFLIPAVLGFLLAFAWIR